MAHCDAGWSRSHPPHQFPAPRVDATGMSLTVHSRHRCSVPRAAGQSLVPKFELSRKVGFQVAVNNRSHAEASNPAAPVSRAKEACAT